MCTNFKQKDSNTFIISHIQVNLFSAVNNAIWLQDKYLSVCQSCPDGRPMDNEVRDYLSDGDLTTNTDVGMSGNCENGQRGANKPYLMRRLPSFSFCNHF